MCIHSYILIYSRRNTGWLLPGQLNVSTVISTHEKWPKIVFILCSRYSCGAFCMVQIYKYYFLSKLHVSHVGTKWHLQSLQFGWPHFTFAIARTAPKRTQCFGYSLLRQRVVKLGIYWMVEPMAIMTQHHMEDKTYGISIRAKCIF